MKSISKLKDEARRHEQREEWEKAIQAYLQVLRIAEEGEEEVELPLYNRLGDLCVRLGKASEAVRHYERAADRYAEAGLYNNAIALCNKALRYSPDRLELVRKLGQFSASQGFITDARRYFLDYAERQFNAGKVTEALTALEDFADISDDAEIREMLGRQLQAHGRTNDAIEELRRAHAMRLSEGNQERATALRQEILAIDPRATVDGAAPRPDTVKARDTVAQIPGLVDIETSPTERFEIESFEDPGNAAVEGLETGKRPGDGDAGLDRIDLPGFETTAEPELDSIETGGGGIEGLETTTLDFQSVDAEAVSLEDLGIEREAMSFGDSVGGSGAETFDLPLLEDPAGTSDLPELDEPGSAFDLPLLGDDDVLAQDEATPLQTPEIDGEGGLDLPGMDGGPTGMDIPGDLALPLDLTSFDLGTSSFDLPSLEEPDEVAPPWKSQEPLFDVPTLDDDALGTLAWEPEEPSALELPPFEPEPEPDELLSAAEIGEPESVPEESIESAGPAATDGVIDIPAIELPTWDTEGTVAGEEAFEVPPDQVEPTWIEAAPDEDEVAQDLPTFTYEEEAEVEEPAEIEEFEDPLGLAADLARHGIAPPTGAASPRPPTPAPAERDPESVAFELETVEPWTESAGMQTPEPESLVPEPGADTAAEIDATAATPDAHWLDDVADDDATVDEPAPWDEPALDVVDGDTADGTGTAPSPAVEDTAAGTRRADDAAKEMAASPPPRSAPAKPDTGYVDLGALITGDDEEETTRFQVKETAPTGDEDRDFAELLSQFKSKVQEHLPPEDAAAHYDLGLAFKEMGLVDEAIGEFQVALRAGHMRLKVYEELGQCFLQKEQYNIAEKVLSRALEMKYDDELELLGVYYHLGRAYEALGRRDQARDAYERVLGMDINFGDVTTRLARL